MMGHIWWSLQIGEMKGALVSRIWMSLRIGKTQPLKGAAPELGHSIYLFLQRLSALRLTAAVCWPPLGSKCGLKGKRQWCFWTLKKKRTESHCHQWISKAVGLYLIPANPYWHIRDHNHLKYADFKFKSGQLGTLVSSWRKLRNLLVYSGVFPFLSSRWQQRLSAPLQPGPSLLTDPLFSSDELPSPALMEARNAWRCSRSWRDHWHV